MLVLHWVPQEDRWHEIQLGDWSAFVGANKWLDENADRAALVGIPPGIAYFVVCALDDDGVTPVNIIPHKYLIDPGGFKGADNFAGFTREDRRDQWELMLRPEMTSADEKRYSELGRKGRDAMQPPRDSAFALVRALGKSPKKGSLAERFLLELFSPGR